MCTYVFGINQDADFPLIVAGNRDEFLNRATTGLTRWVPDFDFWPQERLLLAGKDETSGGTWLGIAEDRWVFVTNIRRPPFDTTFTSTRGELPLRWLSGKMDLIEFNNWIEEHKGNYAPFNLIFGEGPNANFVSSDCLLRSSMASGIYGISNASLNSPWPKVIETKHSFTSLLERKKSTNAALFELLENRETYSQNLPDTGIGLDKEKWLSALFVSSKNYGTRTSTVMRCDRQGKLSLEVKEYQ